MTGVYVCKLSSFPFFFFFFGGVGLLLSCVCDDVSGMQYLFSPAIAKSLEPEARRYQNVQIDRSISQSITRGEKD